MIHLSQKAGLTLIISTSLVMSGCLDLGKSVDDDETSRSGSGFASPPTATTSTATPSTSTATPPSSTTPPTPPVNSPPVISGSAPNGATVGQEYIFAPSASDP